MKDPQVHLTRVGAYALWVVTIALLAAGWAAYDGEEPSMGIMLATSAGVVGLGAATLSIRGFAQHLARLTRLIGKLPPADGDDGHFYSIWR